MAVLGLCYQPGSHESSVRVGKRKNSPGSEAATAGRYRANAGTRTWHQSRQGQVLDDGAGCGPEGGAEGGVCKECMICFKYHYLLKGHCMPFDIFKPTPEQVVANAARIEALRIKREREEVLKRIEQDKKKLKK